MSAEASLGRCEIRAWTSLRIEQIACSRQQRSAPVATTKLSGCDERSTAGRHWTEGGGSKKLIKSPSLV